MNHASGSNLASLAALPQLVRSHPPIYNAPNAIASRYSQGHHLPQPDAYYPEQHPHIDVDALAAGVQRYISTAPTRLPHKFADPSSGSSSYITLPPGIDPATVDFRAFYPYNPSEVKTRKRTSRPQLKVLEETFRKETKPSAALRKSLAARLEMTPRGVQVWFQNRRAKEKLMAKKAQTTVARNPSNSRSDDVDSDADHPKDSTVGGNDDNMDSYATSARSAPTDLNQDSTSSSRHYTSSTSPESTSLDSMSSQSSATAPRVSIVPPENDDAEAIRSDVKIEAGVRKSPSPAPRHSMGDMPMTGFRAGSTLSNSACLMPTSVSDPYLRRPSLPTQLGTPMIRARTASHGSPRWLPSSLNNCVFNAGADPDTRRMSLDRLAGHPYAQFAVHANASRGASMRYRPSLPSTMHSSSTPTLTPHARSSELHDVTSQDALSNDSEPIALPEVSLQIQSSPSFNTHEITPQFSHPRATLPHIGSVHDRAACPAHPYALSMRTYQPPIAGPLPNPNFSFGSPNVAVNEDSNGTLSDSLAAESPELQNYQFPSLQAVKDDPEGETMSAGLEMDRCAGVASRSSGYFHDMRDPNPYATRFGSVASVVSIAESESNVSFFENSNYDTQVDNVTSSALPSNIRRPSFASNTNQVLDMFSNLGVDNNSTNSLPHLQEQQNGIQNRNAEIPISDSSELARALLPDDSHRTPGLIAETSSMSDVHPHDQSQRSSLSSSDLSMGYPLTISTSAASSRSSLHVPLARPRPPTMPRLDTDKLDFMHNYDIISETGHYSPVSYTAPGGFDFPITSNDHRSDNGLMSLPFANHSMSSFQQMSMSQAFYR